MGFDDEHPLTEGTVRELGAAGYRPAGADESARGNRQWWDGASRSYLAEHGEFLGEDDFVWCPEGLRESQARLLGEVAGLRVLEVGAGAAQCSRWLARQGACAVALDLSMGMLRESPRRGTGAPLRPGPEARLPGLVQADARHLPFAAGSFDLACSAYGAVPFVADPDRIMAEVARVLVPGGRWVFSVTHPIRWSFPDDPGEPGLTATRPYFDRTPYVEEDVDGRVLYAEHHRTLGDRVRDIVAAGLRVDDVVEPEWPQAHRRVWGGWSPLRGRLIPGTAIFVTSKPG